MICAECKRDFPERLLAPLQINKGGVNPCCPLCALMIRNLIHGLEPDTPFNGPNAAALHAEARQLYPNSDTLAEGWAHFCRAINLYKASPLQRHEMQKAFYSGAFMLYTLLEGLDESTMDKTIPALLQELQDFYSAINQPHEEPDNATPAN